MSTPTPPLGSFSPADIPWSEVEERLRRAFDYWLVTVRPDGRPHAVPIWGIWADGAFYFYTEPQTQKVRNVGAQPEVVVHLESANDVVIVEGPAQEVPDPSAEWTAIEQAFYAKYKDPATGAGLRLSTAPYPPVVFRVRPRHARTWLHGNAYAQSHWHFS